MPPHRDPTEEQPELQDVSMNPTHDAAMPTPLAPADQLEAPLFSLQAHYTLRLYVAGQKKKSFQALTNLRKICEAHLPDRHTIEVVDLLKNPQMARGHRIFAIPTLVRTAPLPLRKIVGDLSDRQRVLAELDLQVPPAAAEGPQQG